MIEWKWWAYETIERESFERGERIYNQYFSLTELFLYCLSFFAFIQWWIHRQTFIESWWANFKTRSREQKRIFERHSSFTLPTSSIKYVAVLRFNEWIERIKKNNKMASNRKSNEWVIYRLDLNKKKIRNTQEILHKHFEISLFS